MVRLLLEEVDAEAEVEVEGRARALSPAAVPKDSSVSISPLVEADEEGGDSAGREGAP